MKENMKFVTIIIIIVSIICISYRRYNNKSVSSSHSQTNESIRRLNINWAQSFQAIESNIIRKDCDFNGIPTCCSLLSNSSDLNHTSRFHLYESYKNEINTNHDVISHDINYYNHRKCHSIREYIPSQYEIEQIKKAKEFLDIKDANTRYYAILDYAFSYEQIEHSRKWLKRVGAHMASSSDPPYSEDDEKYLSRFVQTYNCSHINKVFVRNEWIEPLTIHSRHPFAWCHSQCIYPKSKGYCKNLTDFENSISIVNADYIIVSSSSANNSEINNDFKIHQSNYNKKYFFDAGSSTFNSGLYWFLCAYANRHMVFKNHH